MSLSRANAVTYLVGHYGTGTNALLQAAEVGLTDASGGLKEPIDEALLLLGTAWTGIGTAAVEDGDVPAALAVLRYTTLKRILAGLNAKTHVDVAVGDVKLAGNQLVGKVERLLALARVEADQYAADYGFELSGAGWGSGVIGLDFIEPVVTGGS